MAQTDDDRAAGVMRFTFGREPASCRALPNAAAQRWFRQYRDAIADLARGLPTLSMDAPERADQMLDTTFALVPRSIAAIKSWDVAGELPSAEWLAENASTSQIMLALEDMKEEAAGPFAREAMTLAMLQVVAESRQRASGNGSSSTGDAPPTKPTKRSARRS